MDDLEKLVDEIRAGLQAKPFTQEEVQRIRKEVNETDPQLRKLNREIAQLRMVLGIFEGKGRKE